MYKLNESIEKIINFDQELIFLKIQNAEENSMKVSYVLD